MAGGPLRLDAGDRTGAPAIRGRAELQLAGEAVEVELTVPAGPVGLDDLLPVFQGLTDFLAERASAGRAISCGPGCGTCCRQMVPISQAEARGLARLVAAMPEPHQSRIQDRFHTAMLALDAAGLLADIDALREGTAEDFEAVGLGYFRLAIPCPFLEAESCSIHPDRPLVCREYLVTSPAENCRDPAPERIARVRLPAKVSAALLLADGADTGTPWMPLVYALGFDAAVPAEPPTKSAPEAIRSVLTRLGNGTDRGTG